MNCPKCGTILQPNAKFCRRCGSNVKSTRTEETHAEQYQYNFNYSNKEKPEYNVDTLANHKEQYDYSYNYSNQTKPKYNLNSSHQDQYDYNYLYSKFNYIPTQTTGDERYLEAYVGPSYQSFKTTKFSFGTLIFGVFYILYRKMYLLALGYFLLILASTFLLGEYADIVNLAIRILVAFKFNELYLAHAERKVDQIKQSNFDKTSLELLDECRKKGGTSITKAIIITIISSILLIVGLISIGITQFFAEENKVQKVQEKLPEKYQIKELSYEKQENLLLLHDDKNLKYYHYNNGNSGCTIKVTADEYNTESIDNYLITLTNKYYDITSQPIMSQVKTSNTSWTSLEAKNPSQELRLYGTKHNNITYTIELISNVEDISTCDKATKNILNTTKFTN